MTSLYKRFTTGWDAYLITALIMAWIGVWMIAAPTTGIMRPLYPVFHIDGTFLGVLFILSAVGIARRPAPLTFLVMSLPLYFYIIFSIMYLFLIPGTNPAYLAVDIGLVVLMRRETLRLAHDAP